MDPRERRQPLHRVHHHVRAAETHDRAANLHKKAADLQSTHAAEMRLVGRIRSAERAERLAGQERELADRERQQAKCERIEAARTAGQEDK